MSITVMDIKELEAPEDFEYLREWLYNLLQEHTQRHAIQCDEVESIYGFLADESIMNTLHPDIELKIRQLVELNAYGEDFFLVVGADIQKVFDWFQNVEFKTYRENRIPDDEMNSLIEDYNWAVMENDAFESCRIGNYEKAQGNIHRAMEWYERAAEWEYGEAQYLLGQCYEQLDNLEEAQEYYLHAYANDEEVALEPLKRLYREGKLPFINDHLFIALENVQDDLPFNNEIKLRRILFNWHDQLLLSKEELLQLIVENVDIATKLRIMKQNLKFMQENKACTDETRFNKISTYYQLVAEQIMHVDSITEEFLPVVMHDFLQVLNAYNGKLESFTGYPEVSEDQQKWAVDVYSQAISDNATELLYELGQFYYEVFEKLDVKWFEIASTRGNYEATYLLGKFIQEGVGAFQPMSKALAYFELASEQGSAEGACAAGKLYKEGRGVQQDIENAVYYLLKAATENIPEAQYLLGSIHEAGYGIPTNYEQAKMWYEKAAIGKNAEAQNALAELYYFGNGAEQDYQKAFEWYERAAMQGQGDAQYSLGFMLRYGAGMKINYKKAMQWFKQAAMQGFNNARVEVGLQYEFGYGVKATPSEAMKWYHLAAEDGDARGQFTLGHSYANGVKGKIDYDKAMYWYRKSAKNGYIDAQFNIGKMFENGEGVEQDYSKAYEWYMVAADQGDSDAQSNIGYLYDCGYGVTQDYEQARKWYLLAANQENAVAQLNLGCLYEHGKGVPQDYEEAAKWYRMSSRQGNEDAQNYIRNLYQNGNIEFPDSFDE